MLWLILGIVLLAIAIAGGAIIHPVIFVLGILAIFMFVSGWRGRSAYLQAARPGTPGGFSRPTPSRLAPAAAVAPLRRGPTSTARRRARAVGCGRGPGSSALATSARWRPSPG